MIKLGKCKKCGICCHPLCLTYDMKKINEKRKENPMNNTKDSDVRFAYKNFISIGRLEAQMMNKNYKDKKWNKYYFYRCRNFDITKKTCKNYKYRTNLCKNFPYYNNWKNLPFITFCNKKCGYRIDQYLYRFFLLILNIYHSLKRKIEKIKVVENEPLEKVPNM